MDVVGDCWSLLIVRDALFGRTKFEDFQASLSIARNILADRLIRLAENGVLERRLYSESPPRHEYLLTAKGRELSCVLTALAAWGQRWETRTPARVRTVDSRSGEVVEQVFVAKRSRAKVPAERVTFEKLKPKASA